MGILRDKMFAVMQLCGLSPSTQEVYVDAVAGLALFYGRSPDRISLPEAQEYLLHLVTDTGLACSTQNCIVAGLRLFYVRVLGQTGCEFWIPRRKEPQRLPEILSHEELARLFAAAKHPKHRALLRTAYAAGLRGSEVIRLQLSDIDSQRMVIRVQQGKGQKDRYTLLTKTLLRELREYWALERPALWLFPSTDPIQHVSDKRLWTIYSKAKQRAGITKAGGPHTLRHCFATHLIESGVPLSTVQSLLGHNSMRTTSRYVHLARPELGEEHSLLDRLDKPKD